MQVFHQNMDMLFKDKIVEKVEKMDTIVVFFFKDKMGNTQNSSSSDIAICSAFRVDI